MKKILIILLTACTVLSCEQEMSMNKTTQQNNFKDVANAVLDEVSPSDIQKAAVTAMSLMEIDTTRYASSKVVADVMNTVGNMTQQTGKNLYESVYNLHALCGTYKFIGGKASKEQGSENSIKINYEDAYIISVEFSSETIKVLYYDSTRYKDYVEVPKSLVVTATASGNQVLKFSLNLDTNINDLTVNINANLVSLAVTSSIEFAGYTINFERIYFKGGDAELITSIHRGEKMIVRETLAIDGLTFIDNEPRSAGAGNLELDFLGEMQVKVAVTDIMSFVQKAMSLENYKYDESNFKAQVAELNTMLETGVYYGGEKKQCWLELYPSYYTSPYIKNGGLWEVAPVLVLADGTRFEDPSDFFSEEYFESVIERAQKLIQELTSGFGE